MTEDVPAPAGHNSNRMSLEDFRRGLASLMSLDFEELVAAGVFHEWQGKDWETFRRDPFRNFFYADEAAADAIWSLIESRQLKRLAA